MNKVRVIVLNFNQPEYTIATVKQLAKQLVVEKEIVVVDNCSTKQNYETLKKGLDRNAILIRSEVNLGYSKGNNLGCRITSGFTPDYYFIINNDVEIEDENLIQKLIVAIENNTKNKVVAASPLVDTISNNTNIEKQIQVRKILPFWKQVIVNSPFLNKIFYQVMNEYLYKDQMPFINKYMICDSINGCAFLINAKVFEMNGYLDEGTFLFFEEIILGKQLKLMGSQCLLDGYTSLKHLQGLSTQSSKSNYNLRMEKEKVASELYYIKKYSKIPKVLVAIFCFFRNIELYLLGIVKR